MNKTSLSPQINRILSIDIIRGIAVLCILVMNIQSFAMISAAYLNPTAYGDLTGFNKAVWTISHVLADQKFMSVFSMLFGVGIILFCDSVEKRGYRPTRFYYRRLFWLFTFGLIHGYLFWHGDILVAYAVCGALAFLFRKLSPMILLVLGLIIFTIPSFNYWLFGSSMEMWPPEAVDRLNLTWAPTEEVIENEITALTGGLAAQLKWRIPETFKMQTYIFFIWLGWRAFAMMLIGMALFKIGIFSIGFSKKFYGIISLMVLPVGYSLIIHGVNKNFEANWSVEYSMFFGSQWNYFGSLFVAIGYLALLMLLTKYFKMSLLSKVGKMAFSNYLLMTIVCTVVFYGFGNFGNVDRLGQLVIVFVVWTLVLIFSWSWLKYFYFGPIEWLWRYLTYGNKPAFVRKRN
ncbi:MAG: DUF418 domain-containing protein [Cytophagales bacterium]|nr:DUF418 domain-containing protein [Cytophagales bacterium]